MKRSPRPQALLAFALWLSAWGAAGPLVADCGDSHLDPGGVFLAGISITAGPELLIDGPVGFTAQEIRFPSPVEIGNGFSAVTSASPCP